MSKLVQTSIQCLVFVLNRWGSKLQQLAVVRYANLVSQASKKMIMLNNDADRIKPSCIIFHKIRVVSLSSEKFSQYVLLLIIKSYQKMNLSLSVSGLLTCLYVLPQLKHFSRLQNQSTSFHALKVHKSSKFFRVKAVFN